METSPDVSTTNDNPLASKIEDDKGSTNRHQREFEWYKTCVTCRSLYGQALSRSWSFSTNIGRATTAGGNKVKIFSCGRCRTEYYCVSHLYSLVQRSALPTLSTPSQSRECQKNHWPLHKLRCNLVRDAISEADKIHLSTGTTLQSDSPTPAQIYHEWRAWNKHFLDGAFPCMVNAMQKVQGDNPKKWHYMFIRIGLKRLPGLLADRPPWARFEVTEFDLHPATEFGVHSLRLLEMCGVWDPQTDEWLAFPDRYGQFLLDTFCPLAEGIDIPLATHNMTFFKHEIDEVDDIPNWREHFFEYVKKECSQWSWI